MSSQTDRDDSRYEIRIKGRLGGRWSTWFEGLSLRDEADGITVIGPTALDQAALHGLLERLRDLGLPLVSLTRLDDGTEPQTATRKEHSR